MNVFFLWKIKEVLQLLKPFKNFTWILSQTKKIRVDKGSQLNNGCRIMIYIKHIMNENLFNPTNVK